MASQTWSDWGRAKAPQARQNHKQPSIPLGILLSLAAWAEGGGRTATWTAATAARLSGALRALIAQ